MRQIFWGIFLPVAVLCWIGSWNGEHPLFSMIQAVISIVVWYIILKIIFAIIKWVQNRNIIFIEMKYYSQTRIIISCVVSGFVFLIVPSIIDELDIDRGNSLYIWGLVSAAFTLAVLLPKIWWNFLLDRLREVSRAIKDDD